MYYVTQHCPNMLDQHCIAKVLLTKRLDAVPHDYSTMANGVARKSTLPSHANPIRVCLKLIIL